MARHPMTTVIQFSARAGAFAAMLIGAAPHAFAACASPAEFGGWLQGFKKEARGARDFAEHVSAMALDGVTYDPATIAKDRGQGVFAQSFLQFSGRMVNSATACSVGSALLKKNAATFDRIEQQYGVPGPVLVGLLGTGDRFRQGDGQHGDDALARHFELRLPPSRGIPRAADRMRCRVIERGDLSPDEMRGPAHGEVGQFQFQPKNYYEYAVDFDGDGRRNLIRSAPDALASAANYLRSIWLASRISPGSSKCACLRICLGTRPTSPSRSRASFWAQHGVTYLNGKPIPADNVPVGLHLPMGRNGPAFLTYPNFDIYLEWNKSLVYSTTAAYYATRLAGAPALSRGNAPVETLSLAETKELQQLLAKRGFDVGKIDGVVGAATRDAIRTMQIKYRAAGRRLSQRRAPRATAWRRLTRA